MRKVWGRIVFVGPAGDVRATVDVVAAADGRGPQIDAVDLVARAQLCAYRVGWRMELRDVSDELAALVELAGLGQVGRQSERREEVRGVEEGMETGDPVA